MSQTDEEEKKTDKEAIFFMPTDNVFDWKATPLAINPASIPDVYESQL